MAHTPKAHDERRPDKHLYPIGSWIGMNIVDKDGQPQVAKARITHYDEGGWAYTGKWHNNGGVALSTFFRPSNCFIVDTPDGNLTSEELEKVKKACQDQHDSKVSLPMRWGVLCNGLPSVYAGGCFNSMGSYFQQGYDALWMPFHGDGLDLPFEAIKDNNIFNECMKAYTRGQNTFEGTERSKEWVHFLLGPKSPWRELNKHLLEKDADYINNAGFIFRSPGELPMKLAYNFALAIRYPWELPRNFSLWRMLLSQGVDATVALFLTNFVAPKVEAKDVDGPYEVIYPWSFLESARLDCAKNFIAGTPLDVRSANQSGMINPNVFGLWKEETEDNVRLFKEMLVHKDMSLSDAIRYVEKARG